MELGERTHHSFAILLYKLLIANSPAQNMETLTSCYLCDTFRQADLLWPLYSLTNFCFDTTSLCDGRYPAPGLHK